MVWLPFASEAPVWYQSLFRDLDPACDQAGMAPSATSLPGAGSHHPFPANRLPMMNSLQPEHASLELPSPTKAAAHSGETGDRTHHRLLTAVAALAGIVSPAMTQASVKEPRFVIDPPNDLRTLRQAGDVNGDGCADFVLSDPWARNGAISGAGVTNVYSGRDATLLWSSRGATAGMFGWAVDGVGDIDGDGNDDIVVTQPLVDVGTIGGPYSGRVWIYSPSDGRLLRAVAATQFAGATYYSWSIGKSVAGVGDIDGDGRGDIAFGATFHEVGVNGPRGAVILVSGATGHTLRILDGNTSPGQSDGYGESVCGVDIDGDGVNEIAVGDIGPIVPATGRVLVHSATTGTRLRTLLVPSSSQERNLGAEVHDAGDVDGDGRHELLATSYWGTTFLFDGATGAVLRTVVGTMASVGDVDGDDHDDWIVGRRTDGSAYQGSATVISGATLSSMHTFHGERDRQYLGTLVSGAGDVNGDGFADFMFSDASSGGILQVYLGGPPARLRVRIDGAAATGAFGRAVAGAGDVDGDGFDDLVIGAEGEDGNGADAGAARVVSGATGLTLWAWPGAAAGDRFGTAVAGAGDVDGDGRADVIVGAPRHSPAGRAAAGMVRVFSGATGALLREFTGSAASDLLGVAVAAAGDVDADGYDDVVVGASGDDRGGAEAGAATVFSGRDGAVLRTVIGAAAGDRLGHAVAGVGDIDRDGFADVGVGAYGDDTNGTDTGSVRVVSGADGSTLRSWTGETTGEFFGYWIAAAGDVDRDGFADVVVGGGATSGARVVRVFSGRTGAQLHRFTNPGANPVSVAGAGDVNGDGHDDVLIGLPAAQPGSPIARVMSGRDGGVLLQQLQQGPSGDRFGIAVAGIGDLDGDGFAEVAVGADGTDTNGTDSGSVFVFGFQHERSRVLRPAIERAFGVPCAGGGGRLPRIGAFDRPGLGRPFEATLRGAPLTPTAAGLLLGARTSISLLPYGLPPCFLLASPALQLWQTTSGDGTASVSLFVPNDASLLGVTFATQWAVVDAGAPYALPMAFSDGLHILIGR